VPPVDPPAPPSVAKVEPQLTVVAKIDPPPGKAAPKPPPKGPNKLLFWKQDFLHTIDPDGKNDAKLNEEGIWPSGSRLSPDGKRVALLVLKKIEKETEDGNVLILRPYLHVKELSDKVLLRDMDIPCQSVAWSADSTRIAVSNWTTSVSGKRSATEHHLMDVETKEKTPLNLPDNHVIQDWTPDGKYLLTKSEDDTRFIQTHLMNLDGTEYKKLNIIAGYRISPDGRLLCISREEREKQAPRSCLTVLDLNSGKLTPIFDLSKGGLSSACWSPDGKQIAYVWYPDLKPNEDINKAPEDLNNTEAECLLMICNEDGTNQRSVTSTKAKTVILVMGSEVDWR
jgi:Tol biopolymer transport system component